MIRNPIYERSATWEYDAYGSLRSSRRRAWYVAGASACLSALSVLAVVALVPLKQAVPYVIQQDPDTGAVRALQPVAPGVLTQNEALIQYMLVKYVQAREGYDRGTIRDGIDTVYVMSTGDAWQEYEQTLTDGHPENPVGRYGDRATVNVAVKSVAFLSDGAASVRFRTEQREGGRATVSHWISMVQYRFVQAPITQEVRFKNPLGFQVTTYRRSSEVVGDE